MKVDQLIATARETMSVRRAASAGIRAPSLHNSQPWRFRLHEGAIEILVDPRNRPSLKVAESAGYSREGVLRAYRPSRDGGRLDLAMYARLR